MFRYWQGASRLNKLFVSEIRVDKPFHLMHAFFRYQILFSFQKFYNSPAKSNV
jgi:hypothetical protein